MVLPGRNSCASAVLLCAIFQARSKRFLSHLLPDAGWPAALVTGVRAVNDDQNALLYIRRSAGDEVAKTTITLIPGEIADFDHYSPSMASDAMLASINDLPDNPLTKKRLEANQLREHVTTSILIGDQDTTLTSTVFRDEEGRETASYLLTSPRPDPRIIGKRPDNSYYYDLSLRTTVQTADGKSIYDQEDQLTGKLTEAQAGVAEKKRFVAEGRLPLAPGTYNVIATLTNNVNHVATRQHNSITVPAVKEKSIAISGLLEYAPPSAIPDPQGQLPFSMSKLRFNPRAAQTVLLRAGDKLPLVFQLWLDPKTESAPAEDKVHLHYVFGAVTASHEAPTEENEDIDVSNRDKAGNILTGHTLDTSNLPIGTYRLVVTATKEGAHQPAYAAMTIHVVRVSDYVDSWTAYGPADPEGVSHDDLKRGMSAEAQGADAEAQGFYTRALAEGPKDLRALDKLAALLQRQGKNEELARSASCRFLKKQRLLRRRCSRSERHSPRPETPRQSCRCLTRKSSSNPQTRSFTGLWQTPVKQPGTALARTTCGIWQARSRSEAPRFKEILDKLKRGA